MCPRGTHQYVETPQQIQRKMDPEYTRMRSNNKGMTAGRIRENMHAMRIMRPEPRIRSIRRHHWESARQLQCGMIILLEDPLKVHILPCERSINRGEGIELVFQEILVL